MKENDIFYNDSNRRIEFFISRPISKITLRGKEYEVYLDDPSIAMFLALLALNNKEVDDILNKSTVHVLDINGNVIFPFNKEIKKD
jgi:hypothetical protein